MSAQPATFQYPGLYQSYLVRLWKDNPTAPWRIVVQSVQSGETMHFADCDQLFAFLMAQTSEAQGVLPETVQQEGPTATVQPSSLPDLDNAEQCQ